jgi:glycosyltransferase involved in cell wall biosynthesis
MLSVNYNFHTLNYFPFEGYGRLESLIKKHIKFNPNSDNVFLLGYPHNVKKPRGKLVYHSVFESTSLPAKWVDPANSASAIITTDIWCKDVFERSGVNVPIYIVPEGTDEFEIYNPDRELFTFLHYSFTSESDRKGSKILLRAFLELFANRADVRLLMKGNTHETDTNFWKTYPRVEYIYANYDRDKMLNLMSKANCFVFPSKGEGFGLPPIEAMAHGIPTIVSDNTAMSTFANLAIPLKMEGKIKSEYTIWENNGFWFQPSIEHLKELMWDVYKNYTKYKSEAVRNQTLVKKYYSFDKIAEKLVEILKNIDTND